MIERLRQRLMLMWKPGPPGTMSAGPSSAFTGSAGSANIRISAEGARVAADQRCEERSKPVQRVGPEASSTSYRIDQWHYV